VRPGFDPSLDCQVVPMAVISRHLISIQAGGTGLSVSYSPPMKNHPAAWLLAVLVALGAGQAVPLSSVQRSREAFGVVQVVKLRRERHARRGGVTRSYPIHDSGNFYSNDLLTIIQDFWSVRLLRAPPLSSIA